MTVQSRHTTTDVVRIAIEATSAHVGSARRRLRQTLGSARVDEAVADDVVLTASELVTNAVESARAGTQVTLEVTVEPEVVVITIENEGPAFHLVAPPSLPGPHAVRGRGLAIAAILTEHLRTEHRDGHNLVTAMLPRVPQRPHSGGAGG